VHKLGN